MTASLPSTREVALHEASHAASLLLSGLPPLAASVHVWASAAGATRIGNVKCDWRSHDHTERNLNEALIAILLGAIADGEPQVSAMHWPVDPDQWMPGNKSDAAQARPRWQSVDVP